jgi:acetyltransferase-like isoleucine patch superfamily enzyme
MLKIILQVIAFFFPSPINIWIHRLAGAKIGKYVSIHPCVLILAKTIEIGSDAKIKFGTMIYVRTFKLGKKSFIGFFALAKGESDLIIGDACMVGPKNMINCSRQVILDYYSGVGPGSYLYTHGSGMPVSEGYRATFGPIHIKEKAWINMRSTIGPGVTVGEGSIIMPGSVILESIDSRRLVVGNPAKLNNLPISLILKKPNSLENLANKILEDYCEWSNEYNGTNWTVNNGVLSVLYKSCPFSITVNGTGDLVIFTSVGSHRDGMYFNLAELETDENKHPEKLAFESFMRLYFGLIFL